MTTPLNSTLALRLARADERNQIRRLAELDDSEPLERPVLVAFLDGEAVAALSLEDGRVVANPFVPTAEVIGLLRLRASHLRNAPPPRGIVTRLRPRLVA
jgi:hypothetical protein